MVLMLATSDGLAISQIVVPSLELPSLSPASGQSAPGDGGFSRLGDTMSGAARDLAATFNAVVERFSA